MLNQIESQRSGGGSSCERTLGESTAEVSGRSAVEMVVPGQMVFREVNEQIAELTRLHNALGITLFVCECGDDGCAESIEIRTAEYKAIRAHGNRFVVLAGHQRPGDEKVVGGNGRFLVVETIPRPAGISGDRWAS